MGYIGFGLLMLGDGGMDDIPNRAIATTYILTGLALVIIDYFRQKKSHCTNRPK